MEEDRKLANPILKSLFFLLAWISLVLGCIGIFLPVLPTTPFVLLAGFFFGKSSERFHSWLLSRPRFGPMVRDWESGQVIRPKIKVYAISILSLAIWSSILLASLELAPKAALVILWIGVSLFLLTRPSW